MFQSGTPVQQKTMLDYKAAHPDEAYLTHLDSPTQPQNQPQPEQESTPEPTPVPKKKWFQSRQ